MERLYAIFVIASVLAFGAFTFYYFNTQISLQPIPGQFNFNESLSPFGATVSGINGVLFDGQNYILYYSSDGVNADAIYIIDTNNLATEQGLLNIYELFSGIYPISNGGTYYRNTEGVILSPLQYSQLANTVFTHSLSNNIVSLNYVETYAGFTNEKQFDIQILGKTLVLEAYSINSPPNHINNYAGLSLGEIGNVSSARAVQVPYMKTATVSVVNGESFVSTYIDWTKSNSNAAPLQIFPSQTGNNYKNSFSSQYIPGENNIYPSFSETAYITLSDDVHDTFMNLHREKSPYRDDLNHRVAWHLQTINRPSAYFGNQGQGGRFTFNAMTMINQLAEYGVKDIFLAFRSSLGLRDNSVTFPETCPPSLWYGTQTSFNQLKDTAFAKGYLFAPFHDDKIDMFQQSIYWNDYCDADRNPLSSGENFPIALDSDGKCKLSGWYTPTQGNGLYYYYIAHDKLMVIAQDQAQCMQNWVDGNAHYLDVLAKVDLRELIDYSSSNSNSRTIAQGLMHNIAIHDFVHETVDGPITAEGGEHNLVGVDTYLAGKIDAHNREIFSREDAPVIPDFELMVYNRLSVGQGMGSIDRWVRQPAGSFEWGQPIVLSDFAINKADKYRATTIAFGHSGFFDDVFMWNYGSSVTIPDFYNYFVKEYYIFLELQKLYLGSYVSDVLYNRNGQMMNLSQTLLSFSLQSQQNTYFQNETQLKIIYENGLEIYVNRHQSDIWQINVNGEDHYLPSNGWFAHHPGTSLITYSALVDNNGNPSPIGNRVDYVRSNEYIMVNGRGVQTSFQNEITGTVVSDYLTVIKPNGWRLIENSTGGFSTSNTVLCGDNYCSANIGENCNTCSTDCGACPLNIPIPPSNLAVTTIDSDSLQLNWQDNSNNEQGFRLQYYLYPDTNWQDVPGASNLAQNTVTFTHNGLSPNSNYYYRISSYNSAGESSFSNIASGLTSQVTSSSGNPSGGGGGGGGGGSSVRPPVVSATQCNDRLDNDGDGLVDYPSDLGCASLNGNSEIGPNQEPQNNVENELPRPLETENKDSQINIIFWTAIAILVSGIALAVVKLMKILRTENKFREIVKVNY